MPEFHNLFLEIASITQRYEQIARTTGENFNIFRTLGIQSKEVRLHSAFIAELLNSKGTHGQNALYLKLFLDHFGLENFDPDNSEAFVEYFTGRISEDGREGGNIDILITDNSNNCIVIENKIYADDQIAQLFRYHNHGSKNYQHTSLLYLTLDGKDASESSRKELEENKYQRISYSVDILSWLEKCLKESVTLPMIRETIHQYINLIKYLTNQSIINAMGNEIKKLLCENPEYLSSIPAIISGYEALKNEILDNFFKILEKQLNERGFEFEIKDTDLKVQLQAGEDSAGVYLAYRLVKKDNRLRCGWSRESNQKLSKNLITKIHANELFERCSHCVKKAIPGTKSSDWSLGWYNPSEFKGNKKLHDIDLYLYVTLVNNEKCIDFVTSLLVEAENLFENVKILSCNSNIQ